MPPKNKILQNLRLAQKADATDNSHNFADIGENEAYFHLGAVTVWKSAFFLKTAKPIYEHLQQNQFTNIYSLPILTRQASTHECTPPPWTKNLFFSVFLRCPSKNLQMSSRPSKIARPFQPKSTPEIFENQQFQRNQTLPKTIFWAFSLDTISAPHPLKPLFV